MKAIASFDELYELSVGTRVLGKKRDGLPGDKVLMPAEGMAVVDVHGDRFTKRSLIGSIHSFVRETEQAVEIDLPIHGVHTLRVLTEREFKMYDRELFILDEIEYSRWINEHSAHSNKTETT